MAEFPIVDLSEESDIEQRLTLLEQKHDEVVALLIRLTTAIGQMGERISGHDHD